VTMVGCYCGDGNLLFTWEQWVIKWH